MTPKKTYAAPRLQKHAPLQDITMLRSAVVVPCDDPWCGFDSNT